MLRTFCYEEEVLSVYLQSFDRKDCARAAIAFALYHRRSRILRHMGDPGSGVPSPSNSYYTRFKGVPGDACFGTGEYFSTYRVLAGKIVSCRCGYSLYYSPGSPYNLKFKGVLGDAYFCTGGSLSK